MVYYDSFGHIILPGEEEHHYIRNNMDPCSRIKYESDKIREERNKSLFRTVEEARKPPVSSTLLNADDLADILKKSRLK